MECISILLPNLLFGTYPDQNIFNDLIKLDIDVIVDLTTVREIKKQDRYQTLNSKVVVETNTNTNSITEEIKNLNYIKYSIADTKIPTNIQTFNNFISNLLTKLKQNKKLYVHCRGGAGRSGLVCVILLKLYLKIELKEAYNKVKTAFYQRKNLSAKMLKLGAPQTKLQYRFVNDYFSDKIKFYSKNEPYFEFSNFYPIKLTIDDKEYASSEHYYQASKYMHVNKTKYNDLVELIRTQSTAGKAYYLAKMTKRTQYKWQIQLNQLIEKYSDCKIDPDWENKKMKVMKKVLLIKFSNSKLKELLLSTNNKEIIENSPRDYFWGCGRDNSGRNELGKMLMQIREKLKE